MVYNHCLKCLTSLTCLAVDTDYSLHAGTREGHTGQWLMDRNRRAASVEVTMCRVVYLALFCHYHAFLPQWNDTAAIPVNSFFSSACIHPSQNSTLHTNEVLKHFWSFGVGIKLHNHIMIQENKWSGIIKDNYCAIADSIMTLHCWYVEGRCALSLTPGMMGRGPGAPLGPVCSVTNDNLSLLPLPHNCDTAPRCSQCWPRSQHQSPHQNCNRALGPAHSVYTVCCTEWGVSVHTVQCSWCVIVGGPGPGHVSR